MNNGVTVSIKNFQIIESATLNFEKGLNCIIGPSNNGKSAIFRAIKSLIYNEPGTDRIRKGANSYAVGMQINNNIVLFQKGLKESLYKINGVVYEKPGRVQLEEVAEATGIKELNLNGKNEQLNFWYQMEKPFLLDRSETDLFRFIVDSGKDNRTTLALKDMVSDKQAKGTELNLLEGRIAQLDADLESYARQLDNSEYKLSVCNKIIEFGPLIGRLNEMTRLIGIIKECKEQMSRVNSELELYNRVLESLHNSFGLLEESMAKTKVYETILNNIEDYGSRLNSINTELDAVDKYLNSRYADKIERVLKLELVYLRLSGLRKEIVNLDNQIERYNQYKGIDESVIKKLVDMDMLITKFKLMKNSYNNIEADLNNYTTELEKTREELKSFKVCPLCNRPL